MPKVRFGVVVELARAFMASSHGRASEMPKAERRTFKVRDPLPPVPIPLHDGESTTLNLRACLDRAYDEARYDEELDDALPSTPKLDDEQARWAKRWLAALAPQPKKK